MTFADVYFFPVYITVLFQRCKEVDKYTKNSSLTQFPWIDLIN